MNEKMLGKITRAEFGRYDPCSFLFGFQLEFSFESGGVGDGGKYTWNTSEECKWSRQEKLDVIEKMMNLVNRTLGDAKVDYVSQLVGKPVEVTFTNWAFEDFRILTEVI